jgi:hypothetical protein
MVFILLLAFIFLGGLRWRDTLEKYCNSRVQEQPCICLAAKSTCAHSGSRRGSSNRWDRRLTNRHPSRPFQCSLISCSFILFDPRLLMLLHLLYVDHNKPVGYRWQAPWWIPRGQVEESFRLFPFCSLSHQSCLRAYPENWSTSLQWHVPFVFSTVFAGTMFSYLIDDSAALDPSTSSPRHSLHSCVFPEELLYYGQVQSGLKLLGPQVLSPAVQEGRAIRISRSAAAPHNTSKRAALVPSPGG